MPMAELEKLTRSISQVEISPSIRVERVSTSQLPIPSITAGQRLNGFPLRPLIPWVFASSNIGRTTSTDGYRSR
ncbi:hypothetical protein GE21DRAFT_1345412 [Neurospora crassa]|nr:hypothetical protein GE21DRAFT_1345412 [Neurospora crassa]